MKTREPKEAEWERFVSEGLNGWDVNNQNVRHDFRRMSKQFGLSYIFWLEIQYSLFKEDSGFSLKELSLWNGDVPESFFKKFED